MKNLFALTFCCFTFFTSFGQDSTGLFVNSIFKVHLSTGGSFLKNIEAEYLGARIPLTMVEGGIEFGNKVNFEINVRGTFGNVDTLNLNFMKLNFGVNNKSQLSKDLFFVIRLGAGVVFENDDYQTNRSITDNRIRFLRIGGGVEQKLYKESVMMVNFGYDISKDALFSGLGISVGVKVGIPRTTAEDVPYF